MLKVLCVKSPRRWMGLVAAVALAAAPLLARAEVKLPAIISDNMCLQQGKPLPIWGTANPGEKVTVSIAGQTQSAVADAKGKWMVKLAALPAGGPLEMTVSGTNALAVHNVLVGEVWVASGQSNMEWRFSNAHNVETEAPKANYPKIRIFNLQKATSLEPVEDCKGVWEECTPTTAPNTSAVGYFFVRDIHEALKLPVGLIHTSWGGTPAQAWTSMETLKCDPEMKGYVDAYTELVEHPEKAKARYEKNLEKWQEDTKKWQEKYGQAWKEAYAAWNKQAAAAKAAGKAEPAKPNIPQAPRKPNDPLKDQNAPSTLYNAMIAPIIPFGIQGAIWYQGESNAGKAMEYRKLFPDMITDWRKHWGEGDFGFYWVQLANYMNRDEQPTQTSDGWPGLREAQHMTLSLPKTGEAVTIDVGQANDIHPKDKMDVGHRLALAALHTTYCKDVVYSGPTCCGVKFEGGKARVSFKNVGGGLSILAAPSTQPSVPQEKPLDHLVGFSIAGEDHKFVWAHAKIEGDSVVVWSDEVKEPKAVRYAWANNPAANLYNKEGIPASPFRTDDWVNPVAPAPAKK